MRLFTLLLSLLFLPACCCRHVEVDLQYLNCQLLASYWVDTPDPHLDYPDVGQRLIVCWSLPSDYFNCANLHAFVQIRRGDYTEETYTIPLCRARGSWTYSLLNQEYFAHCGILTYQVLIIGDGRVLDCYRHHVWTPIIRVVE